MLFNDLKETYRLGSTWKTCYCGELQRETWHYLFYILMF